MKEKNLICLLENDVGGGWGVRDTLGWGFSNEYIFVEPS